ncbi:hypothetical protein M433DRAFT_139163 [Acidomyces richmondensis BFW]|nr:hypothetical protein M433DRAFT_139163 [Acidomyces richmondensis BFW]
MRRYRGGRGGLPIQSRTVNGRQFGGHLSQDARPESTSAHTSHQLQAEAPVFIPGQVQAAAAQKPPSKSQPKPHPKQRRPSKSQAPDIATRTHEDIDHGYYECPICTGEVQRKSKIWSCHTCWTVFHLSCIKKWSSNAGSSATHNQAQDDALPSRQWRCPGCNLPKDTLPKNYTCWCEKELEPRAPVGLPPHSCGNTCGRERAKRCPHPCELICHSGPCPPCAHMGPTQLCFCGKHSVTKRCSETNYEGGWSCGNICGKLMTCQMHTCMRPCHDGTCGPCEVRVPARCYCGQCEKEILCSEQGTPKKSIRPHASNQIEAITEIWTGLFNCGNLCDRFFDCGAHRCRQSCHAQQEQPTHCPLSPDVVTHCPCSKTPLSELSQQPRRSCSDPVPSCSKPCGKILACGHICDQVCHVGDCPTCMKTVEISCRCSRTTSKTVCHQGKEEPPQCMRICRTLLSCGRHSCDERCCPGESKGRERQISRRKARPLGSAPRVVDDGFEAEHICTRQCGRSLTCGLHTCFELCHKGPCPGCREAIFEEIFCNCGKTVLHPPLPCGTKAPPCKYPCGRTKRCGHPQVPHNCHGDDEECPKCPFLVQKRCLCGKHALKNQPCWLQDVRCGDICGKRLRCGSHFCRKPCHRSSDCEDADIKPCEQPCGKPKKICGHPDLEDKCHAPYACKEDKPCQSKIYITCLCQTQKQEMKCAASKHSEGNSKKVLPCNDECARLERNRKLALALNIDPATHVEGGDHIPYSSDTLNLFAANPKWAQTQEREFRVFAASEGEKRLRFKPMRAQERAFVHALAEDYGFDSESMDPEPHRHVMIWKTPRFVSAPTKTLAEAHRIKTSQRPLGTSANVSENEEPYNGYVIDSPRFGLTVDELKSELAQVAHPGVSFDIEFLPNEQVILKALSRTLTPSELQRALESVKIPLITCISAKGFGKAQLCTTDSSLNILRRELDHPGGDGWSRVAAKKAAPRIALQANALKETNSFAALTGGKVTFSKRSAEKRKTKVETVVDDWEAAELAEEEKERSGEEDGGVKAEPAGGQAANCGENIVHRA